MTIKQALKRQYLETKTRAGVRYGQHRNAKLAQDWVEHGESNFLFEVRNRVKPSEDPAFNAAEELEMLVSLWRQEIPYIGELGYAEPRSKTR